MTVIFLTNIDLYFLLDSEFGLTENIGAAGLLVTSILLLLAALSYYSKRSDVIMAIIFVFAGLAFFWAAGEEISWGQHFLGWNTPEWMSEINDQNETNLHNINKKLFDRILDRSTVILVAISTMFCLMGRSHLWKIALPPVFMTMSFALLGAYRHHEVIDFDFWTVGLVFVLFYIYRGLKTKNKLEWMAGAVVIGLSCLIVMIHYSNHQLFGTSSNIAHEIRETAFSLVCVFYSIYLLKDAKK